MTKVLILAEGQTEETFVRDILNPFLQQKKIYCIPTLAITRRVKSGPDFKGGFISYEKAKNDIKQLLKDTSAAKVTTMIDYYGFTSKVPFKTSIAGNSCFDRVKSLEKLFKEDIGHSRFLPYLQLHEFEALVFVSTEATAAALLQENKKEQMDRIKRQYNSVEEIDDSPNTAPSKRLAELFPGYDKPRHGPLIVKRTGLEEIRRQCSHFNQWITQLENL
jgi:hypothetical protein